MLPPQLQQYGFAPPPDDEMLQALMRNQQQANAGQLKIPQLEQQMLRAEQLRDKPMPKSTHWLSALAGLGNKAAGIRDVRKTEAAQRANNSALAKSQAAVQQYAAQQGVRNEQNTQAQIALESAQAKAAAAAQAERYKQEDALEREKMQNRIDVANINKLPKALNKGKAERFYTKDGQPMAGYVQRDGSYVTTDGATVPAEQVKTFGTNGIRTAAEKSQMAHMPAMLEKTYGYMDYTPEDWDKVMRPLGRSVGHTVIAKFLNSTEKTGFNDFLEEIGVGKRLLMSDECRAALQNSFSVLNDIRTNVIMPYREDNTSGALSDRDVQEFVTNIGFDENMSGEAAYDAAQRLFGKQEAYARQRLQNYDTYGDEEAWSYANPGMKVLREDGWKEKRAEAARQEKIKQEEAMNYQKQVDALEAMAARGDQQAMQLLEQLRAQMGGSPRATPDGGI